MISLLNILAISALRQFNILPLTGMIPWKSASRESLHAPSAESPSTMYISRFSGSLLRQSTNFCTRFAISMLPESFFFMPSLVFSAASRLRLLTSTCSAILSASGLFSIKYISRRSLKKSVIASWMKRLVIAFLVWFSYEVCVEKQFVTSTRQSATS